MMAPYLVRLFCLCLAVFFLIHSTAGLAVALTGSAAIRTARRMRSRRAERFLLVLRLMPAALALCVVAGICVPSYLWLEPEISAEEVGAGCLAAAILAAALLAISTARGVRATVRSARHARSCELLGRRSTLAGSPEPVWILDSPVPLFALVGVFGSRVAISRSVMNALPEGPLAAALRHEGAHRLSHDNLKRLLLLLAPDLFPGFSGFDALERNWARFTEWAADDEAVAGDAHVSLCLAAALIRVARMGGAPAPWPLSAAFLGDSRELSARVDRLLTPNLAAPIRTANSAVTAAGVAVAVVGCAATMLHPATLGWAHRMIERLIH